MSDPPRSPGQTAGQTAAPRRDQPTPSIHSVLAAVDLSVPSSAAAARAAHIAARFRAQLTLLHVLPDAPPTALDSPQEARERLEAFAHDIVRDRPAELLVRSGRPTGTILSVIREREPDLVVMATHGRGVFRRALLGSVVSQLLHDAERPILTGAHLAEHDAAPPDTYRHIACALEFDERDPRVLAWAAMLAAQFGAQLSAIHVASNPEQWRIASALPVEEAQRLTVDEWRQRFLRHTSARLTTLLRESHARAEVIADVGDIERELPDAVRSHDVDLLVIGRSRPAHGLHLSPGVSHHTYGLIQHAPCPVLSV